MSKKVCVCIPHGGAVHPELYRGLFQMQNALGPKGYQFAYTEVDMASIAKARNMSVQACVDGNFDYVHFLDDDVILPENVAQLYDTDADVISGLYFARQWPHTPQMYTKADAEKHPEQAGKYWPVLEYNPGIMEVDAAGAGCLLIKVSVLRRMREVWEKKLVEVADFVSEHRNDMPGYFAAMGMKLSPWFEFTDERGEDFYFCERAREAGYRVLVDTNVKCGHLTWLKLTEEHYKELFNRGVIKFGEGHEEGE